MTHAGRMQEEPSVAAHTLCRDKLGVRRIRLMQGKVKRDESVQPGDCCCVESELAFLVGKRKAAPQHRKRHTHDTC